MKYHASKIHMVKFEHCFKNKVLNTKYLFSVLQKISLQMSYTLQGTSDGKWPTEVLNFIHNLIVFKEVKAYILVSIKYDTVT